MLAIMGWSVIVMFLIFLISLGLKQVHEKSVVLLNSKAVM